MAVALGNLAFGPLVDVIGARPVMYFGALSALALAWWCDVSRWSLTFLDDEPETLPEGRSDAVEPSGATGLDEHGVTAGE